MWRKWCSSFDYAHLWLYQEICIALFERSVGHTIHLLHTSFWFLLTTHHIRLASLAYSDVFASQNVAFTLLELSLLTPHPPQQHETVVNHVLQHVALVFLRRSGFKKFLRHVIGPDELTYYLLTLPSTCLKICGKVYLTNVVPGECSDCSLAVRVGQCALKNSQGLTCLIPSLNS